MSADATPLKSTLGLRDLVLAQILIVTGLNWFGPAARLGSAQWIYWLIAILLFHIPLAIVVVHLSRRVPIEGGTYQWAKAAFNDFTGFLVAWNFWMFITLFTSTLGLNVTTALGYATGAGEAWMSNRVVQFAVSAGVTATLMLLAIAGFSAAKWLHNAATIGLLVAVALLIALPFIARVPHVEAKAQPFSAMQLVLFTRIAVYALAGFEAMSIVIAETRGGAKAIARSIAIAVPCIAAIYIFGTRSVLALVPAESVDLVNPLSQTFTVALGGAVAPFAILLVMMRDFAQSSLAFSVATRMPLVAGWDHVLPEWFTRLHPRTKTPVSSILFAGGVMLACSFTAIVLSGREEAFQILLSIGGVFFATTYLVLFAMPLIARSSPWWLRIVAASGFVVTAAFVVLSFVPIVDVASRTRYAAIIAIAVLAANAIGATIFLTSGRVSSSPQQLKEGENHARTR